MTSDVQAKSFSEIDTHTHWFIQKPLQQYFTRGQYDPFKVKQPNPIFFYYEIISGKIEGAKLAQLQFLFNSLSNNDNGDIVNLNEDSPQLKTFFFLTKHYFGNRTLTPPPRNATEHTQSSIEF